MEFEDTGAKKDFALYIAQQVAIAVLSHAGQMALNEMRHKLQNIQASRSAKKMKKIQQQRKNKNVNIEN